MKRAVLVGFKADSSAEIIGGAQPFSEALSAYKTSVGSGIPPAPGIVKIELWEANPTKAWKFKPEQIIPEDSAESADAEAPRRGRRPKSD